MSNRLSSSRLLLAAALSCVLIAASSGCSALGLGDRVPAVIEPHIVPASGQSGSRTVSLSFEFEDKRVKLSVPLDRAVYAGSVSAQKDAIFLGGKQPPDWVAGYYRAFIDEDHQAAFYDSILEALGELRRKEGLDSARFVELVVCMAQGLEYRTDPVNLAPKFPIETFGDGYGDCDDKTLLAAALLSKEGYDVAILLFSPEKHVAMGIRAPGLDYKDTGYAYVEMTEPSLVGVPAEELSGGIQLTSQPEVIKIGGGEAAYTAGGQIEYIQRRLAEVVSAAEDLKAQIDKSQTELTDMRKSLEEQRAALSSISDPAELGAAINRYNDGVAEYNDLAAELRRLVGTYNGLVDVQNYVVSHQYARPQVYERLRAVSL
jgi:hypothetical protein